MSIGFYDFQIRHAKRFGPDIAALMSVALADSATALTAGTAASATTAAASAAAASTAGAGLSMGTLGLIGGGLGLAGLTSYMSYSQAQQAQAAQSQYMEESYAAQQAAIEIQNQQLMAQESVEARKAVSQSQLLQSRIRAAAGESGLGLGGTYEALMRQVDYDAQLNLDILGTNTQNNIRASNSQMRPMNSQQFNPLMDALSTGIGGFATGLSIGDSVRRIA